MQKIVGARTLVDQSDDGCKVRCEGWLKKKRRRGGEQKRKLWVT